MWIAFKNYYLRYEGQLYCFLTLPPSSCELLSKIIIFVMKDNKRIKYKTYSKVVNCFQKLLSSWWRTTKPIMIYTGNWLWIAFKNYYLRDEGQQRIWYSQSRYSCELLSKIIIFVMKDNVRSSATSTWVVVNCFQKLLSSWWRTTIVSPVR